jgi:hypothetical protein
MRHAAWHEGVGAGDRDLVADQDIWIKPKALIRFRVSVPNFCSRIEGMIYGYARVSREAQDVTGSTAQLRAAGC